MWENLNLSSSGHYDTLFKIIGITVVLGILGLAYKVYKARTGGSSVSKKTDQPNSDLGITAPSSPSSQSVPISEAEKKKPLPNGVQEWQVEEMIQIFTKHFKALENSVSSASFNFDPMKMRVVCTDVERICKELDQYNHLFDYLKEKEVINSYAFERCNHCSVVLSEKFVQTLKAPSSISTNEKLFANDRSSTVPSAASSSVVAPHAIEKKQLPNGIKEENIKACLDYIKKNPHKGSYTHDEATLIEFDASIPGNKVAEFTKGVDGWNYNTFFDHLVKEGYIKKYHIVGRNYETFVWM